MQEALHLVEEYLPAAAPSAWGPDEPLRERGAGVELPAGWEHSLLWRDANGRARGEIRPRRGSRTHSLISIDVSHAIVDSNSLAEFLRTLAVHAEADYACAHLLTLAEVEDTPRTLIIRNPFDESRPVLAIYPTTLRQGLPDLYWANVLGRPYASLFGEDLLRTLPAAVATDLSCGWYVQLTRSLDDVMTDYPTFRITRQLAKNHLGQVAFFDQDRPYAVAPISFSETACLTKMLSAIVAGRGADAQLGQRFLGEARRRPLPGGGERRLLLFELARRMSKTAPRPGAAPAEKRSFWASATVQRELADVLGDIQSLPLPSELDKSQLLRSRM